jgi:hypothetical protein
MVGQTRPGRAGALAVASVAVVTLLVVALATWASSIGTSDVLRGDDSSTRATATSASTVTVSPQATATPQSSQEPRETPGWFRVLAIVVGAAAILVALYLVVRIVSWGVRTAREKWVRRRREAAVDEAFDVIDRPAAVAREMLADADAQRQALTTGTPRNAVVACWHRFETQAAAAGLERQAWETSSEYTMRVLDLVDAYQPAVSRLAELYREARFSEHELTEEHRREALEALDTIHRTIGVMA